MHAPFPQVVGTALHALGELSLHGTFRNAEPGRDLPLRHALKLAEKDDFTGALRQGGQCGGEKIDFFLTAEVGDDIRAIFQDGPRIQINQRFCRR